MRAQSLVGVLLLATILSGCAETDSTEGPTQTGGPKTGTGSGTSAGPAASSAPAVTPGPARPGETPSYRLTPFAENLALPVHVAHANDSSGRVFIVEKGGRVWIYENGARLPTPFLDVSLQVSSESEQGLLSIAFDPRFKENRRVFVSYTDLRGDSVVGFFLVSTADRNRVDPLSFRQILTIDQPYANHNGGLLVFGPDGYLYAGFGDGGSSGDPQGNGQNKDTLLGKLLRLDVSSGQGYQSPSTNPFHGATEGRDEIWAWGLRNPWRFSFDRTTGDLYIADVGQDKWEEINFQARASAGGENYGWNSFEGDHPYEGSADREGFTFPVAEYSSSSGAGHCSITGGHVYRGSVIPTMAGHYVFADLCSAAIFSLNRDSSGWKARLIGDVDDHTDLPSVAGYAISAIGEDEAGELYIVHLAGTVFRFVPR